MNGPANIVSLGYPQCAHDGCERAATDGYCLATCCNGYQAPRAYCSEHSHRPTRLLEILGHSPAKSTFTRDEVRNLVMSLWAGAGLVFEAEGYLAMHRDAQMARDAMARMQTAAAAEPAMVAEPPKPGD